MKLVFIYGPPAVGKLTVARELARLTEYKIFHNHLTTDVVSRLFKIGSKPFLDLLFKIRLDMLEAAAKTNVHGLIFTTMYGPAKRDNTFIKKLIAKIKKYRGKIYFVHLHCDRKELFRRVKMHDRRQFGKINEAKTLEQVFKKWGPFIKIPFAESLSIDNTNISAKEAARRIKKYYHL